MPTPNLDTEQAEAAEEVMVAELAAALGETLVVAAVAPATSVGLATQGQQA
jgi:hypothetical protein